MRSSPATGAAAGRLGGYADARWGWGCRAARRRPRFSFERERGANPNASQGLERAESRAEPGGESLAESIETDAGRGNGGEFLGDPGNSGNRNQGGG